MKYDVIIVGAGASGMMAAITAASHHKKVLLLERMDKLGKKILATGNGRCNLSNAYMDENCYRGQRPSFAYPMIEEFGLEDLIQFFESLGMLVTEQNGYYYPASLQAATVVDTLTQKLKHLHVDILTEFEVTKAEKRKSTFYVYGNDKCFQSSNLILATGGCAQPNLGSNGSGYKLAKDFHHKICFLFLFTRIPISIHSISPPLIKFYKSNFMDLYICILNFQCAFIFYKARTYTRFHGIY